MFPLSGQRQGQIDGDLRLSGAVVAGEDRDAVGKHSNINNPPVGTIKDTIYDLIIKEMKNRSAWRLTRDVTPECAKCLHRYLCPPPSNYGFVIGKFNLCHLK